MTKEELEKENAELKNTICTHEYYQNGYKQGKLEESRKREVEIFKIQGAIELRDVRIAELEKENAEAKKIIKDLLGSENQHCEEEMFFTIRRRAEDFIKDC